MFEVEIKCGESLEFISERESEALPEWIYLVNPTTVRVNKIPSYELRDFCWDRCCGHLPSLDAKYLMSSLLYHLYKGITDFLEQELSKASDAVTNAAVTMPALNYLVDGKHGYTAHVYRVGENCTPQTELYAQGIEAAGWPEDMPKTIESLRAWIQPRAEEWLQQKYNNNK